MKRTNLPASNAALWGYQDAADYVGVTVKTITNWVRDRRVSVIKLGRVVRFDPDKFKRELTAFERKALTE